MSCKRKEEQFIIKLRNWSLMLYQKNPYTHKLIISERKITMLGTVSLKTVITCLIPAKTELAAGECNVTRF